MSCFHKPDNTETLRRLIAEGRVIVDTENGVPRKADGTPYLLEANFGGYLRFRVRVDGREPWFFVHKAVMLAMGHAIPEGHQIDHINRDNADNRGANLRLVTPRENVANRQITFELNGVLHGAPAF